MLCVVAHDAGGAEVLASYVARSGLECIYVLAGPAVAVFQRRIGDVAISSLEEAVQGANELLCGTSWQSDLEWHAIALGKRANKHIVAFLDHWSHYRERFIRRGVEHLPDEIWVSDAAAESLALDSFPGLSIRLVANPYFEDIRDEAARLESALPLRHHEGKLNVLFVCEPIADHARREFGDARHWGYTEYGALNYFIENLAALEKPVARIVVRPHPADPKGKYDWVTAHFGEHVVAGGSKSLLEEVVESDVVVGCTSMALVVALVARRRAISCIPPGGAPCALPHSEIESFQHLAEFKGRRLLS